MITESIKTPDLKWQGLTQGDHQSTTCFNKEQERTRKYNNITIKNSKGDMMDQQQSLKKRRVSNFNWFSYCMDVSETCDRALWWIKIMFWSIFSSSYRNGLKKLKWITLTIDYERVTIVFMDAICVLACECSSASNLWSKCLQLSWRISFSSLSLKTNPYHCESRVNYKFLDFIIFTF